MKPYVVLEDVCKTFGRGAREVQAVRNVSLSVGEGELVALKGRSGSGKTTLINCIGGLDAATSGQIRIGEHQVTAMSEAQILELRRTTIAYVFQSFGLIPVLTVAENVSVPLRLARLAPKERDQRVREVLDMVDLGHHAMHLPGQLSGGQQQRVALARALVARPRLLLADEPTGQLDSETGATIMGLIGDLVRETGMTALIATHDDALMRFADRVVEMRDGRLVSAGDADAPTPRPRPVPAPAVPADAPDAGADEPAAAPRDGWDDDEPSAPRPRRRRAVPLVAGGLAVALLAGGAWLATRDEDRPAAAPAPRTSDRADIIGAPKQLPLGVPQGVPEASYQLPPTVAAALSGDYADGDRAVVTVRREGSGLTATEQLTAGAPAKPLALTPGPDGTWTARTTGGIGLTLAGFDDDAVLLRLVTRSAAARKPVWLGQAAPPYPGLSVDMWTVPMGPADVRRAYAWHQEGYDERGARVAPETLGRAGYWSQAAHIPTVEGCEAVVQDTMLREDEFTVTFILPDVGAHASIQAQLADAALKATVAEVDTATGTDAARVSLKVTFPKGSRPRGSHPGAEVTDPGLAVTRLTWQGAHGGSWTWLGPTLDSRHATTTCPARTGGPATSTSGGAR